MGEIWKGAPVAAALCASLTDRISALRAAGVEPALAILRAGERGDDIAYENGAVKRCEKLGIAVRRVRLPPGCTKEEVLKLLDASDYTGDAAVRAEAVIERAENQSIRLKSAK